MHSLAHYALLGSLLAGAAGALILIAVTVRHGLKRRGLPDGDEVPEDVVRRHRTVRLADTAAVLCFAISAGLGVVGLMQHTRAVPPPGATADEGQVAERLSALEKRVASAELELQSRSGAAPESRVWEDRLVRLESRLGAVEERAAIVERRGPAPRAPLPRAVAPAAVTPRSAPKAVPAPVVPSASPSVPPPETVVPPARATAPLDPPAPAVTTEPPVASIPPARREPAQARTEAADDDVPILEKIRRDWDEVKRHARRGGDEWREGWDQIKRLFR
jgi:hypothetical protein